SIPQLKAAIKELQSKGYAIPSYPDEPQNEAEKEAKSRYDKIKGSAVNPVLREGNSDRRAPKAVKNYAKKNPHSMGAWTKDSKTHVSTMADGDFAHNEKSITFSDATTITIVHTDKQVNTTILKYKICLLIDEIIEDIIINKNVLVTYYKLVIYYILFINLLIKFFIYSKNILFKLLYIILLAIYVFFYFIF